MRRQGRRRALRAAPLRVYAKTEDRRASHAPVESGRISRSRERRARCCGGVERAPSRAVDGVGRWASGKTTTVDRDAKTVEEGGREVFSGRSSLSDWPGPSRSTRPRARRWIYWRSDLRGCREFWPAYVAVSRATAMKKLRVLNLILLWCGAPARGGVRRPAAVAGPARGLRGRGGGESRFCSR